MDVEFVDPHSDERDKLLSKCDRFWDPVSGTGISAKQATEEHLKSCKFVLIRDDGWTLASPDFDSAYNLWADSWDKCIIL